MHMSKISTLLKLGVLSGFALVTLAGCEGNSSVGSGGNPSTTATTNPGGMSQVKSGDMYAVRLGSGFDSITHSATSDQSCLANAAYTESNIAVHNFQAMFMLDQPGNINGLQRALNVDVTGPYGGDRFSTSTVAKFVNDSKDTQYTTNLIYMYQYAGTSVFKDGVIGVGVGALKPSAADLLEKSPTDFRALCGNEFVSQMDLGATLAVRLKLKFNSHMDKVEFNSQLVNQVSLAHVIELVESAASNPNSHVELIVSAIQQGGEPEKLDDVFNQSKNDDSYPSLRCQTGNGTPDTDPCNLMANKIIAYSQTLSKQVSNPDGSPNLSKLYFSNPITTSYNKLGINVTGAKDPSSEVLQTMKELTTNYDKARYAEVFSNHYTIALHDKLDKSVKNDLKDVSNKLYHQINNVYLDQSYDILNCYKGYVSDKCLTIRDNVNQALAKYALTNAQNDLIGYLEGNSYSAKLINYYGNDVPKTMDYRMSKQECTLVPVSNQTSSNYILNCNHAWLQTEHPSGITITRNSTGNLIGVQNLAYVSISPKSGVGQMIKYDDIGLPLSTYYDSYFHTSNVGITAPEFSTVDADLGMYQLSENPA